MCQEGQGGAGTATDMNTSDKTSKNRGSTVLNVAANGNILYVRHLIGHGTDLNVADDVSIIELSL